MKTAISIPDPLFEAAEQAARRRGCSRSQLYAEALERLLDGEPDDTTTTRLDAVYAEVPSHIDDDLIAAQRRAIGEP